MAEDQLARLLATLGGPGFGAVFAGFDGFEERVCDILLAITAGDLRMKFGDPRADAAAVAGDLIEVMSRAARRWPDRFVKLAADHPRLRQHVLVLQALGGVDSAGAAELLIAATQLRAFGLTTTRWIALRSLLELDHPSLPDVLLPLIGDRAALVRSAAIEAAIGHGDVRLIDRLLPAAARRGNPIGTVDDAFDAIEAIATRSGLTDVMHHNRLVFVPRPRSTQPIRVESVAPIRVPVRAGDELAVLRLGARRRPVPAPVDGVVVSSRLIPGRRPPGILFWLRT
jgi:hypothetical protein